MALVIGGSASIAQALLLPSPSVVGIHEQRLYPRWETQYADFSDLQQESSAVVRGKVTGIEGTFVLTQDPLDSMRTTFMTTYKFEISDVLFGEVDTSAVPIVQLGGERLGVRASVHDQPPYEIGAEYILFLRQYKFANAPEGAFISVGGPQGELRVIDGMLYSADHFLSEASWIAARADAMPISDLVMEIRGSSE